MVRQSRIGVLILAACALMAFPSLASADFSFNVYNAFFDESGYPSEFHGEQAEGVVGGKKIKQNEITTTFGGITRCGEATYDGSLPAETQELITTPSFVSCYKGGVIPATVQPENECEMRFMITSKALQTPVTGDLWLCKTWIKTPTYSCGITMVPAQVLPGLTFTNVNYGNGEEVEVNVNVSNLEYWHNDTDCGSEPGYHSDGKFRGVVLFSAP